LHQVYNWTLYYILGVSITAVLSFPILENPRRKGLEVFYMVDQALKVALRAHGIVSEKEEIQKIISDVGHGRSGTIKMAVAPWLARNCK
jgi:HSP90 family molecular chaperone